MSIVSQRFLKNNQGANRDFAGTSLTEILYIEFSEVQSDSLEALKSAEIFVGDPHRNHEELSIDTIDTESMSGTQWFLTINYTTQATFDNPNGDENTDFRFSVEVDSWSYEKVTEYDRETGVAIANSARDRFDPPPTQTVTYPVLIVSKKENSANIQRLEDVGKINNGTSKIAGVTIPKFCGMLSGYEPNTMRDEEGNLYFTNVFTFRLNFDVNENGATIGFKLRLLDAGFNKLENGKQVAITKGNEVVVTPALLDGSGGELSETADPVYKEFVVNDTVNFGNFGLPSSFPAY